MQYAIALPQLGRAASAQSIMDTARLAEQLGYSDVWVNDHIGFAPSTEHPSPRMYDPLSCLALAAAATSRIGLGSHINAAYYPPVYLAKVLASLDSLSGGRVKIAVGVGWQPEEFAAMGSDFSTRGKRTDEIVAILRSCWDTGSSEFAGEHYSFPAVKISPPPAHTIPVWIAGTTPPALSRAVRLGDGYHGLPTRREPVTYDRQTGVSALPALIRGLREARPDPAEFTVSMYTHDWDPGEFDAAAIARERDFFEEAGVQHVVAALSRRDSASWMQAVEDLARIVKL
jgi:probable F420-dependent oxidoreductase